MNIYKNFLSDIKIYYNDQYSLFLNRLRLDANNSLVEVALFPIIVREFIDEHFDFELIEVFRSEYIKDNEQKDDFTNKMYFTVASFLQPSNMLNLFDINKKQVVDQIKSSQENVEILSKIKNFKSIRKYGECLEQEDSKKCKIDEIDYQCKGIFNLIKNDFLGYLRQKRIEIRKLKVLEIYRYLYRFSFVKTQKLVDDTMFMILIFQYLKATQMKRIHQR